MFLFGVNMGIHFQKFCINIGIHFDSWAVEPTTKLGQVPPGQTDKISFLQVLESVLDDYDDAEPGPSDTDASEDTYTHYPQKDLGLPCGLQFDSTIS